jgi:hypothetical protein
VNYSPRFDELAEELGVEKARQLLEEVDVDGDGLITMAEFSQWWNRKQLQIKSKILVSKSGIQRWVVWSLN